MNVFVLCTGRCGSTTFIRACEHMTNYTAGHETRCQLLGPDRLAYPDNHIEADNRLSWFLGRLDAAYGDDAFYVHLTRDPDAVARSILGRRDVHSWQGSILRAYQNGILQMSQEPPLSVSRDYVDTITANIGLFLRDKTHWMPMRLETAADDFAVFWDRIEATGDKSAALAEWDQVRNVNDPKPPPQPTPPLPYRIARRAARSIGIALR